VKKILFFNLFLISVFG